MMIFFEKLRNYGFWIMDSLKGGHVAKHYKDIKYIFENKNHNRSQEKQAKHLNKLLIHAVETTLFYNKYKNFSSISDFQIIDKNIIRENAESFFSNLYNRKKLYKISTSGSTGTPFVSYQNIDKKKRNTADALYFGSLAGYKSGETLLYLKIWSSGNRKSKVLQISQNIVPVDVIQLTGNRVENFINKINTTSKRLHINGYSSALEEVCKYLDLQSSNILKQNLNIGSIIAQSEALSNTTKERLFRYFKCLPCSRYSNLENGIIAQQTIKKNKIFTINQASYYIEILKIDKDIPARAGEYGRIVVTDFFNYAMPFIRYDTGDIGRFLVNNNGEIDSKYITEIQGRKLDLLLDTSGNIVSSYIMYKNMYKYPEIDQYQLIQESKRHYRFIISMKGKLLKEDILRNEFTTYLGHDARFDIEYVEEIPLLASGKRRKIVNNFIKLAKKDK